MDRGRGGGSLRAGAPAPEAHGLLLQAKSQCRISAGRLRLSSGLCAGLLLAAPRPRCGIAAQTAAAQPLTRIWRRPREGGRGSVVIWCARALAR